MKNIRIKELFTYNLSYKVVSLFIALILWVTILGRRDVVTSRNIELEMVLPPSYQLVSQSADFVKVRVTGSRSALKRFLDSGAAQLIAVHVNPKAEGNYEVEVPLAKIDVPFGVKVLSVKPSKVQVQVLRK